jgi:DNA-binding MarR family transcriptional regulator
MTQTTVGEPTATLLQQSGRLNQEMLQLTRAMHVLRTHVVAHTAGGVPWSTYTLLFHLVSGGPRRAGALAECVYVDPSTISRQVDQLVKLGLVERRADPVDGRATLLAATEAGVEIHRRLRASRDRMLAGLLQDWPDEDVARLTELLGRLNQDVDAAMPQLLASLTAGSTDATADVQDLTDSAGSTDETEDDA